MPESISEIKTGIVDICKKCLDMKNKMISSGEGSFKCYIGGGRQFHPQEERPYVRTIYLSRDSKRYDEVPEDVIDLNEVYTLYKRKYNHDEWEDHPYHSDFDEAIHSLRDENYFLLLDLQDIRDNNYNAKHFVAPKDQPSHGWQVKITRFVKLNLDMINK